MPTYEYECGVCGCRFERKQGYQEAAKAKCPQCEGRSKRVLQSSPVIFKGSGFYVTDSRKSGDTQKAPKTSDTEKTHKG